MNTQSEIQNEIRELSPFLAEIREKGKNPFLVPSGYFAEGKSFLGDIPFREEKDLRIKVDSSMKVPEGYFRDLRKELLEIPDREERKEGRIVHLDRYRNRQKIAFLSYVRMAAGVAAMLLIVLVSWKLVNRPVTETLTDEDLLAQLMEQHSVDKEDVRDYMVMQAASLHEDDILSLVDEGNLEALEDEYFEISEEYILENIDQFELYYYYQ